MAIQRTFSIIKPDATKRNLTGAIASKLEEAGLKISGRHPERNLVETIELPEHPWFIGCQFHPELQSKPLKPHPMFSSFIKAAYANRQSRLKNISSSTKKEKASVA